MLWNWCCLCDIFVIVVKLSYYLSAITSEIKEKEVTYYFIYVSHNLITFHWFVAGDAEGIVSILGRCEEIQRGGSICCRVDEGPQTTCTARIWDAGWTWWINRHLFKSLQAESTVRLVDDPLHNKYINYYDHFQDERKKRHPRHNPGLLPK